MDHYKDKWKSLQQSLKAALKKFKYKQSLKREEELQAASQYEQAQSYENEDDTYGVYGEPQPPLMMGYKYSGGGDLMTSGGGQGAMNSGMKSRMISSFTNNDVIMEVDEETFRPQNAEETPYHEDEYSHMPNHLESRFDHHTTYVGEEERVLNEEDLEAFAHISLQDQPLSIFDNSPRDEEMKTAASKPKMTRQKMMVRQATVADLPTAEQVL